MPLYYRENIEKASGASHTYTDEDLKDLLYGLGMSASGGGGGYLVGEALIEAIIRDIPVNKRVLFSVESAADDDFAVMTGGIGAPSAITPTTITKFADYCLAAIQAYTKEQGKKVNALLPVEAGPVNALLSLYLGWRNDLKVFDCDGAGRAVPSLTNLVFGYNNYPIAPMYLAGIKTGETKITADEVTPPPKDAAAAEGAIRDNLSKYNRAAGLVCWGQTGLQLKNSKYLVRNQFDVLRKFGGTCRKYQSSKNFLENTLRRNDLVDKVYSMELIDVQEKEEAGYDVDILKLGDRTFGVLWTITALNENMTMHRKLIADEYITAPNGIALLFDVDGRGTYVPLNNGDGLKNAKVIGHNALIIVLKERCMLYEGDIGKSFLNVLQTDAIDYHGPIQPTKCVSG